MLGEQYGDAAAEHRSERTDGHIRSKGTAHGGKGVGETGHGEPDG